MREGDDVIDARAQQHEQDAEPHHRIGRRERDQHCHQQRHDDKVGRDQCAEEAYLAEGAAEFGQRDLEEGHEQHQRQRRIDRGFPRCRTRHDKSDDRAEDHGGKVDGDLSAFEKIAQRRGVHAFAPLLAVRRLRPKPSASSAIITACAAIPSVVG